MARKTDLSLLRNNSLRDILRVEEQFAVFSEIIPIEEYYLLRGIASMAIVDLNAIWERYTEERLVIALNHNPQYFIGNNNINGINTIPKGLAKIIVRGSFKYFDFRSTRELINKGNKLLGVKNPFLELKGKPSIQYLDTLLAIKNCITHWSDSSTVEYKKAINKTFDIKSAPEVGEFLNAIDYRKASPINKGKRLLVLTTIVKECINMV
jgi:hypothetical protein